MFLDCIGCGKVRLDDEPIEDRIRKKKNRPKFSLATKLYGLKQLESSHPEMKQVREILLKKDVSLVKFAGKLSASNYLAEIDRLAEYESPFPENQTIVKQKKKKKRIVKPVVEKVYPTNRRCSRCKRLRLSDEPKECVSYAQCPRCVMKRRIKDDVAVPIPETIKLYGFKQMQERGDMDKDVIERALEEEPFLKQFKNRKFDYYKEIKKYQSDSDDDNESESTDSERTDSESESSSESELDDETLRPNYDRLTKENLNIHHAKSYRVHLKDIHLVTPDNT
ncbi:hypothetical protein SBY92_001966 [Candida maltosa Xu316]